jgi:hypothetical protein
MHKRFRTRQHSAYFDALQLLSQSDSTNTTKWVRVLVCQTGTASWQLAV